jgi:hypothetical protein
MDGSIWALVASGLSALILAVDGRPAPAPTAGNEQLAQLVALHRAAAQDARLLPVAAPRCVHED